MSARWLALGDSYTIGEGVAPDERWPALLVGALRARAVDVRDPEIVARTGWTTAELSTALEATAPRGGRPFDLVSLLVGVNDQYRGYSSGQYRRSFADLLASALVVAGGDPRHVLVLSIPDWGITPFGARDARGPPAISAAIAEFNRVNREEARRLQTRYVDVTGISRRALEDPALLAADGLHPSAAMYRMWVALIAPEALDALRDAAGPSPA